MEDDFPLSGHPLGEADSFQSYFSMNQVHNAGSLPPERTDAHTDAPSRRSRPVGVTIITVLCLLAVVVLGYRVVDAFVVLGATGLDSDVRTEVRQQLLVSVLLLPFFAVIGVGLWRLTEWARLLAVGFLVFTIASFVYQAFGFPSLPYGLLAALSRSVVPATMLLYLLHPSIRTVFGSR